MLKLAVPEQHPPDSGEEMLHPAAIRDRLSRLPLLNTLDSLRQIHDSLHRMNRLSMRAGLRSESLDLYRVPIQFIGQNIEKQLASALFPHSNRHSRLAELCRETMLEMAFGYKSVILERAESVRSNLYGSEITQMIYRAMWYLAGALRNFALSYASCPSGIWRELHTLYAYAGRRGVQQNAVKDSLHQDLGPSSVAQVYKQSILFGLVDPYRLSAAGIRGTFRYLDQWAALAEVRPYATPPTHRCQFVIDPDADRPARSYLETRTDEKGDHCLLLDTRGLTRRIHEQWNQIRAGFDLTESGLDNEFRKETWSEILEKSVLAWGLSPSRQFPREDRRTPFVLSPGLESVNYCLNNESRFRCNSENEAGDVQTVITGTFGQQQFNRPEPEIGRQCWQSINDSVLGLQLEVSIEDEQKIIIRVGDMAAFKADEDQSEWEVGVVRWARMEGLMLRIGLQKFIADAQAIAVRPVSAPESQYQHFKNSVMLSPVAALQQPKTLITPPRIYARHRNLFVDDGEILHMFRCQRLMERNAHYEWFEYEDLDL